MSRLNLALAVSLLTHATASAQPIAGMSEGQTISLLAVAFLVVFGAIGGYLIYAGLKNRRLAQASELWPMAGGTVLGAEVTTRTYRNPKARTTTTTYAPQIRYAYRVTGTDYESAVIRFGDLESGNSKFAEELVAKYPAGATVAVRYDPESPERAALETVSAGGTQVWTGAVFIVVPLIIVIVTALIVGFSEDMQSDLPPEVLEQLNQPN
ncbi:MAG: DUF3592 domain-containing protein [Methyloceanibacter sp.]